MSDDLAEVYDIPQGVVHRADHLERIEADDGTELRVIVSASGERDLVHADVVEYDGALNHPATTGAIGFLWILAGLLAPIVGGLHIASGAGGTVLTVVPIVGGIVGGWLLANVLLYRTVFGDWCFRFFEWNDHKTTLMVRGEGA